MTKYQHDKYLNPRCSVTEKILMAFGVVAIAFTIVVLAKIYFLM